MAYQCSTAYLLHICDGYAGLNMDTRVSVVHSARQNRPNQVEFDLSKQHTRIPRVVHAACECVYTNQRDRLEHIRIGSLRTTRCWVNTRGLRV